MNCPGCRSARLRIAPSRRTRLRSGTARARNAPARAYGLPRRDVVALLAKMVRRFFTRPQQFLFPPRGGAAKAGEAAHA